MIAGLRSRTLSGHPDDPLRILRLSERLRNLEPRLRSSEAFFSSDFRFNHSNETPITIPVKKTNANANQRRWLSARRLLKTVVAIALEKTVVAMPSGSKTFSSNHFLRIGVMRGISRRPQIPNRNGFSHLDMEPCWLAQRHSHPAELNVKPDHRPAPKNPNADSLPTALTASFQQIIRRLDCQGRLAFANPKGPRVIVSPRVVVRPGKAERPAKKDRTY